jgi:hypothetical protein
MNLQCHHYGIFEDKKLEGNCNGLNIDMFHKEPLVGSEVITAW